MRERLYTTSARFYDTDGKFIVTDNMDWFLRSNAQFDAREWLDEVPDLLPTNISVRGPDGRFIKWKH